MANAKTVHVLFKQRFVAGIFSPTNPSVKQVNLYKGYGAAPLTDFVSIPFHLEDDDTLQLRIEQDKPYIAQVAANGSTRTLHAMSEALLKNSDGQHDLQYDLLYITEQGSYLLMTRNAHQLQNNEQAVIFVYAPAPENNLPAEGRHTGSLSFKAGDMVEGFLPAFSRAAYMEREEFFKRVQEVQYINPN